MSRSFKHSPCGGWACCSSEKEWKQRNNRTLRRHNNIIQKTITLDPTDDPVMSTQKDMSNGQVWNWGKDGKQQWWRECLNPNLSLERTLEVLSWMRK